MDYIKNYYENYDEDNRLTSKHGLVEYITTQKIIHECAKAVSGKNILEIGAGTGRYSIPLAEDGFNVTAVELVEHNIEVFLNKLSGSEGITVLQGNALDLSRFDDNGFDITLLLGPMYHLYSTKDKVQALSEAVRVTKPGGFILVSYCMNEPTVIQYVFYGGNLQKVIENNMLTDNWHCKSEPKEIFELIRTEEIMELDKTVPVERVKLVATDGATNYFRQTIDTMDDKTFEKWVEYHLSICERQDLIGASHHTLDVLRKKEAGI
ncbi:MAG: class I SAM-dependent methyltransferase [Clostridia bacterium]|nr:class I SAM-dependent methyltransferase [Clostridia bacterium]